MNSQYVSQLKATLDCVVATLTERGIEPRHLDVTSPN